MGFLMGRLYLFSACLSLLLCVGCGQEATNTAATNDAGQPNGSSTITEAAALQSADTDNIQPDKPAFLLITGGDIITMEPEQSSVEAVVSHNERIAFVGSLEQAKQRYPTATVFDLQDDVMMPGFIEQHMHPFLGALTLQMAVIAT